MTSDGTSALENMPATLGGSACPVCHNKVESAADAGPFQLFRCGDCRSWCSDANLRGATTPWIPENYFANDAADLDAWRALERRLGGEPLNVRSALDVGCGTGAYLRHLRDGFPGIRRVGIELDHERALMARTTDPEAEIHIGDAAACLAEIEGRFDLITLWDVFEHVPEPAALLEGLAPKLAERGAIAIQTIHEESLVPALARLSYRMTGGRLQGPIRRTHAAHHLVFFSQPGLERLAEAANLQIRERWFSRLMWARMDGNPLVTLSTAALLRLENALGNGLFINLILEARD